MSLTPTNIAQSLAGLGHAERTVAREGAKRETEKAAGRRAVQDQLDLVVVKTEHDDAVRSLKGNADEEARQDRREHGTGSANSHDDQARPSIDVSA
jgi:hypothetical protein